MMNGSYYYPQYAPAQLAPQGFVGDLLGQVGSPIGQFIGGHFGHPALGQQIGGTVGNIAQTFLPFSAAPQFAPQGFFGDVLGAVGAKLQPCGTQQCPCRIMQRNVKRAVIRLPVGIRSNHVNPVKALFLSKANVILKPRGWSNRSFNRIILPFESVGS